MTRDLSADVLLYATLMVFALALLIVLTKRWHGELTFDFAEGVQKLHTEPTPRIGGVPILVGLATVWSSMPASVQALMEPVMLAAVPAIAFGLAEDVTGRVGVAARLTATLLSGVLFSLLSGYSVTRVDLPIADRMLVFMPVSIALTAFAAGGVANAINIIDGLNGLAGIAVLFALAGLGAIAQISGDLTVAHACWLLGAAVFGFLCVNWPLGKIFLGDGGAYFLGFVLACLAILLTERNSQVSVFAVLLVCVHPVTEVLFSVWRRRFRGHQSGRADCLHLHSLVKRRFVSRWLPNEANRVRNSVAGLIVGGMNAASASCAVALHDSTVLSLLAVFVFVMGYVTLYARLVRFRWGSPIGFLLLSRPKSR